MYEYSIPQVFSGLIKLDRQNRGMLVRVSLLDVGVKINLDKVLMRIYV